jgi:LacI family transcriptional regulator
VYFAPPNLECPSSRWLRGWRGDGILAHITTRRQATAFRATGLPVIDMSGALADSSFLAVLADNRSIAQLAFAHLSEHGSTHFAYCGLSPDQHWHLSRRGEAFRRLVEGAGFSYSEFHFQKKQASWEREQEELVAWLYAQPKPLGIFACCDDRGYQVLDACRCIGLPVPQDVAVLGVGDDPVLCNLTNPPMSSIRFDNEQAGYLAAAWLDRLMDGHPRAPQSILLPAGDLVIRGSTDTFACNDPAVIRVLRFIREHACEGIRVRDLPSVAHLSLSELERRFHRYFHRTPKAELLRVQIESAKRLLSDTDLALKIISHRVGFSSVQYFSDAFYNHCGVRPMAYRLLHRRESLIAHPLDGGS